MKASKANNFKTVFPEEAKYWHPQKNGTLSPCEVAPKSNKKVWWKCEKGHEWMAMVCNRTGVNKTDCPYCSGHRPTADNNFAVQFPRLLKEWHFKKNDPLNPEKCTPYSQSNVWWICEKGHEWQTTISHRSRGRGCPYCSGNKVSEDNCLENTNPKLAKEWHPTKNGSLTPATVSKGSNKEVWWLCSEKKEHEWLARIDERAIRKYGCPYCSGKRVCTDNCLKTINPKLAKEWHPAKNGSLTPENVTPGSNKRAWWLCSKNKNHEWESMINDRNMGTGCPLCSGKRVSKDNCLQAINPKLAKEWHPAKNGSLTPENVTPGFGRKVWWLCSKNKKHEWDEIIRNRNKSDGCPHCSGKRR